jgi:hypothetical protein
METYLTLVTMNDDWVILFLHQNAHHHIDSLIRGFGRPFLVGHHGNVKAANTIFQEELFHRRGGIFVNKSTERL